MLSMLLVERCFSACFSFKLTRWAARMSLTLTWSSTRRLRHTGEFSSCSLASLSPREGSWDGSMVSWALDVPRFLNL